MLAQGIIQPTRVPFKQALVLLLKNKDITWKFCTNYRALNTITIKDTFPIPTINELLDELHGDTRFSKLNLSSSYHQFLVKVEDRRHIAFHTHQGLYEWLVMPFGLISDLVAFQSPIN